jgi:hypothetical protein
MTLIVSFCFTIGKVPKALKLLRSIVLAALLEACPPPPAYTLRITANVNAAVNTRTLRILFIPASRKKF